MAKINAERLELARKSFEDRGESIVEWARRNRFHPDTVYAILGGRNKGTRGGCFDPDPSTSITMVKKAATAMRNFSQTLIDNIV